MAEIERRARVIFITEALRAAMCLMRAILSVTCVFRYLLLNDNVIHILHRRLQTEM